MKKLKITFSIIILLLLSCLFILNNKTTYSLKDIISNSTSNKQITSIELSISYPIYKEVLITNNDKIDEILNILKDLKLEKEDVHNKNPGYDIKIKSDSQSFLGATIYSSNSITIFNSSDNTVNSYKIINEFDANIFKEILEAN